MDVLIRPERADDYQAIQDVTQRAFAPMPYADGDEQELIGRFRDADVLALSLVAEKNGVVVGQVSFTPAIAADDTPGWYALGPVSVDPEVNHRGIGSQLINAGIAWLKEQDAAGCILIGNPAYYSRFGFVPFPELAPDGMPAQFFQILPLRAAEPNAVVEFHPLFGE